MTEPLRDLLGLGVSPQDMTLLQVSMRAVVIFFAALAVTRFADKRFLARMTAFDAILAFILGSMLARAINGSAPLFESIGGAVVLAAIHRLTGLAARHSHRFSRLVKGDSDVLIRDGQIIEDTMRRNHLSEQDVLEELRLEGQVDSPAQVRQAIVERNGKVSVIRRET